MRLSRNQAAAVKARKEAAKRGAQRKRDEATFKKEVLRKPDGPRYPVTRIL